MRSSWTLCALGALVSRAAAQATPGTTLEATPQPESTPAPTPGPDSDEGYANEPEPEVGALSWTTYFENPAACSDLELCTVRVTHPIVYSTVTVTDSNPPSTVTATVTVTDTATGDCDVEWTTHIVVTTTTRTIETSYPVTATTLIDCANPTIIYPEPTYAVDPELEGRDEAHLEKRQCCNEARSVGDEIRKRQCCPLPDPPIYTCGTVTITEWTTTTTTQLETILDPTTATATRTVNVPTTVAVPTTIPITNTVSITDTVIQTSWQTTTSVTTDTITTSYPVTVTSDHTIIETRTTTEVQTTVRTLTTSFPVTVTAPGETVIQPPETVTAPGETITQPPATVTAPGEVITLPGETVTTTITEDGEIITTTVVLPPVTTTQPGEVITLPGEVTTLPGETVTTTITEDGEIITTTVVLPPITTTQPGEVITVTPIFDVTLCPMPTGRSVPFDPRSNLTFGCSPGYVCDPPKPAGCNLYPEPPADDFVCEPEHCILSPPFSETHWPEGETHYYPPSYGYFNLNPHAFGLSYDIFEFEVIEKVKEGTTVTITTGNWESQASLSQLPLPTTSSYAEPYKRRIYAKRQDDGEDEEDDEDDGPDTIPDLCFAPCNDALKVALQVGKGDELCDEGSSFQTAIGSCNVCADVNQDTPKAIVRETLDAEFYQFVEYCGGRDSDPTETSATAPESAITEPDVSTTSQGDISTGGTFTVIDPSTTVTVEPTTTEATTLPTSTVPEETETTSFETTVVDTTTIAETTETEETSIPIPTESTTAETTIDESTSVVSTPVETTIIETTTIASSSDVSIPEETVEPTTTTPAESEEPSFSTPGTPTPSVIPTGSLPPNVPGEPSTIPTAAAVANGVPLHLGAILPAIAMFFA